MKKVLLDIFALFFNTNPESPYGLDRADEFRFKRALYEEKVKYFTKKYADPDLNKIYDNSDCVFSFN
jgi:ubiquitin-protein ligase